MLVFYSQQGKLLFRVTFRTTINYDFRVHLTKRKADESFDKSLKSLVTEWTNEPRFLVVKKGQIASQRFIFYKFRLLVYLIKLQLF